MRSELFCCQAVHSMNIRRYIVFSVLSGCVWAVFAYVLAHRAMPTIVWGGLLASPLIGIVIGLAFRRACRFSTVVRWALSLVSLYFAAVLFGACSGICDILVSNNTDRILSAVVLQAVLATLWGLTVTGYFLLLWPLSFLNHALLCRIAESPDHS